MDELQRWLSSVGLEQLGPILSAQDVDIEVLRGLSESDLEKIGVSLGLRKKVLRALEQMPLPSVEGASSSSSPAERRQLTVLFCDLVGSTAMSARLDPEEMSRVLNAYRAAIAAEIKTLDGHVAQYLGDGVMAYFGWPRAHEDEAERAVRAGLAAVEATRTLTIEVPTSLSVRVGIATGLVVVGDQSTQIETAVGETPNLAARLQALADPGTVVVDFATHRQLGELFEVEPLGSVQVKGIDHAVPVWRVLRRSRIESRFEALHATGLTPLVGREEELQLLRRRWERAKAGSGQVVMICGEPGIGKSRVTETFVDRIAGDPHTKIRQFCSPHHRDSALHPSASQIERAAGFERDDAPATKLDKLEALFIAGENAAEDRRLVAELLRLPELSRYPALALNPQQRKHRTFDALLRQLDLLAARQPVLYVFEDVHWIDPTSQELLDRTLERIACLAVLVVLTFRPEFAPPWTGQPNVTLLTLNRLDRSDGIALIERVGKHQLSADVVREIVERADGVPLFAEELTKAVLEAEVDETQHFLAHVPMPNVPATLHASLMARLDRLGRAKEVAQIAAAIGRDVSYELLLAVAPPGESELNSALQQLVASGLLVARGTPPDATYQFKHALVQDASYGTLLLSARQKLHARIADVLESSFPQIAEREPEILARHHSEARQPQKAVDYWFKAGRFAAERSANLEAIRHLSRALEMLRLLPESMERDRQELLAQTAIGTPLMSVHGYAAPETGAAHGRARVLSLRVGDRQGMYATLSGEYPYHFVRGDLPMMLQVSNETRATAEALNDDSFRMVAHRFAGMEAMYVGEFDRAIGEFGTLAARYDAKLHRPPPVHYVHDPKIIGISYLAILHWIQGRPDDGRRWSDASIAYIEELHHANQTAFCHVYGGAGYYELLHDVAAVEKHVNVILEVAAQYNLLYFRLSGLVLQGWLTALGGDVAEGAALMRRTIDERFALGVGWYQVRYLCMLAEIYLSHTDAAAGLEAIGRAQCHIDSQHEAMWQAEVHRLEGELRLLAGEGAEAAEGCWRKALLVARRQGAKSFELRTSMSLARLQGEQGARQAAYEQLRAVLGSLSQGFETADYRRANELLRALQ